MVNVIDFLGTVALGGIVTLVVREAFSWKFPQLEKQIKRKERLLEKVYGPIRVLAWRLKNEMWQNAYVCFKEEHIEVRRIFHQYNYEMDSNYRDLLKYYIECGNKKLDKTDKRIDTTDPTKISALIELTEKKHKELIYDLNNLNKMRRGIRSNLRFLFRVWNFYD